MLNLIKYDFEGIFFRIEAIFLSIVLFLVGFIYKDTPIEIEYTVKINETEISAGNNIEIPAGDSISVYCYCENKGRPFEGTDLHDNAHVSFYRYEGSKKIYLSLSGVSVDAEPNPILIKSGEKFTEPFRAYLDPDAEAGTYSVEVTVFGHKQVYENILTVI